MLRIKLIPAGYGESIWVSVGETERYNILIDGGLGKTYQKYLEPEIKHIKEMKIKKLNRLHNMEQLFVICISLQS